MTAPLVAGSKRLHTLGLYATRHEVRTTRRPYSNGHLSRPLGQPIRARTPSFAQPARRLAFRRSYADGAPRPGTTRLVFRWLWRFTYISALGGLGFVGYQIYTLRYPIEQAEPDPGKKSLVILGA